MSLHWRRIAFSMVMVPRAVADPVLEEEGGGGGVADGAAVGAAVGERDDDVVALEEAAHEIEVAVGVVQDREVDEAGAVVGAQEIVGVGGRVLAQRLRAGGDGFGLGGFVVEAFAHLVVQAEALRDGHQQHLHIGFGVDVGFGEQAGLEGRVLQFGPLLRPGELGDFGPAGLEQEGVDCAAPGHEDAVSAQRDLRDDVGAFGVPLGGFGHLLFPGQLLGDGLEHGEGDGEAGFLAQRAHPAELVPLAAEIGGHFEDAMAGAGDGAADADELFLGGGGAGDEFAVDGLVEDGARGREAECASLQAFLDDGRHLGDFMFGGVFVAGAALAHHIGADGAVGDVGGDVDGAGALFEGIEIFGEGFPVPAHPFDERGSGDVLDALHQADEPLVAIRPGGGEADAAIAHDDGCDAVPAAGGHFRIPGGLAVIMGVDVDEAGGDVKASGVDFGAALCGHLADDGDAVAVDCHIALEGGVAGAVDDGAAADDHIVHVLSPSVGRVSRARRLVTRRIRWDISGSRRRGAAAGLLPVEQAVSRAICAQGLRLRSRSRSR